MLAPLTFAGGYAYVQRVFQVMFERGTTSRRVILGESLTDCIECDKAIFELKLDGTAVLAIVAVQMALKWMPDTSCKYPPLAIQDL